MALVIGVNAGFVETAPTANPDAPGNAGIDDLSRIHGDTSPSTAAKIIEMGWYDKTGGTQEANFEVGLYAADGAVVPGEAGTLLQVSRTNAKGTGGGWHVVTGLDWNISPNTEYWLGVQLDNTATQTILGFNSTGGAGHDFEFPSSTLPDPFDSGAFAADGILAIYAVVEVAEPSPTIQGITSITGVQSITI